MEYCKQHNKKAYTESEADNLHECPYAGLYQDVEDKLVRLYCFYPLHKSMGLCSVPKQCE